MFLDREMNVERRSWRFSLSSLMMTVFVVAVVLAVVPYPVVSFYLILFVLFLAAVFHRVGPVNQRSFWFFFAIFGWLYVILGISFVEVVESSPQWFELRSWIMDQGWSSWGWAPKHYLLAAHGLIALLIAFSGAMIGTRLSTFMD